MDELYRMSGLYHDKWERQNYREPTILNAVRGCQNVYGSRNSETPPPRPDVDADDAVIERLAKLTPLQYARVREAEAAALGVSVRALDKQVAQKQASEREAKGRAVQLYEPDPWPDPVTGVEVLNAAAAAIKKHMVIRPEDADACALWCAHTYIYKSFDHTPRLMITAPTAECGKTVLMSHLVGNLVNKPQPVELMKPAPFFRLAESYQPTFLIDEVDVFIQEDSELLAAINNGWEPHGNVTRCVGDDYDVRCFSTHTPVAVAGIGLYKKLPSTTVSRSITIELQRATLDEIQEDDLYDSRKHKAALLEIGRKFARWCKDVCKQVSTTRPVIPRGVRNRLSDKWGALLALAQAAGGDWPTRAEKALFAQQDASEPTKSERLLADTRRVVTVAVISTEDLIKALCAIEESIWKGYNFRQREEDRRKITSEQLARLLAPYKVKPDQIWIRGRNTRGYRLSDFKNAWARYLPTEAPPPPGGRAT
jgi:putative DNA primase/helicase